ncbi:secreted/surface protein with fasciclin-like repeats [Mycolicibacterium chubuense NBB4]|uniref:Secreted/surface protein with fasciclin-like repeats n=1 Tax=Mycolicibacterium chubuense (strain NBB4) TaxID=710421 RepID=I4BN64_MYCCN|nr:fasciclin domain-containing protein [Mycolicibacterium chubuense]AFM18721.1 secreted/surface protein with fasciclin-like repeats [Mycolicibacterium chubuense NBB4]
MKTRTSKAIGVAVGAAAIALSVPLAVNAYAEPTTTTNTPVAEIPDPQGPKCDDFKKAVPNWKSLADVPVGKVLSAIPDISSFNAAVSGQLNPAVNIVPVLENGPFVVFAPTNDAFAALPPEQQEMLRTDPAALTKLAYYHVFLGLLGPDDVKGQRPSQEGTEVEVTGSGGDIKVNETTKVVCGGIQAQNARIYIVDKVLDPTEAPAPIGRTTASSTATSATSTTQTLPAEAPAAPAPATSPAPAAEAPIG